MHKHLFFIFAGILTASTTQASSRATQDQIKIEKLIREFEDDIKVPTLSVKALLKDLQKPENGIVLVDVRDDDEQEVSMISGAITDAEFEKNMDRYKNKKVVAYCTIGYRSGKFAQKLRKQGFNAWNLRGSLLSWLQNEQPVVDKNGKPTKKIHVFGDKWDVVPDGYESVKKSSWFYKVLGY